MARIRVLVVDDSVVVRRLVVDALARDEAIEVVGTAANGRIALAKAEQLAPDLITMDIEMPELDGIEAVRQLRRRGDRMPIVMFSTLTERGASATLEALSVGATDYVTKPANQGSVQQALRSVADQLVPKIRALVPRPVASQRSSGAPRVAAAEPRAAVRLAERRTTTAPVRAVVLGSSTGGPEALSKVFSALTEPLPVPLLVVQHMPPVFTTQLAARLDRLGVMEVHEAAGGEALRPGVAYIAPGDFHLELSSSGAAARTVITQAPPVNFCRPSVDVLFRSAVGVYGGNLLGVVLTGMGSDGAAGARSIVEAGGTVIAQDQATSVVWGMPGAVASAGAAHQLLPITEVAPAIASIVRSSAATAARGGR